MKVLLSAFALAILASSCLERSHVKITIPKANPQFDGLSPEQAYSQFRYRMVCRSGEDKNPPYELVTITNSANSDIVVGSTSKGNLLIAKLRLYLMENGHYKVTYMEYEKIPSENPAEKGFELQLREKETDDGNWAIENNKLVMDGFGEAVYFKFNSQPALSISVNSKYKFKALSVNKLLGLKSYAETGPSGEDDSSLCRAQ